MSMVRVPPNFFGGFDFFSVVSNNSQHVASRAEIGATRRRKCSETWAPGSRRGLSIFGPHFRRKPPSTTRDRGARKRGAGNSENPEDICWLLFETAEKNRNHRNPL